jgi:hypothetical protein
MSLKTQPDPTGNPFPPPPIIPCEKPAKPAPPAPKNKA